MPLCTNEYQYHCWDIILKHDTSHRIRELQVYIQSTAAEDVDTSSMTTYSPLLTMHVYSPTTHTYKNSSQLECVGNDWNILLWCIKENKTDNQSSVNFCQVNLSNILKDNLFVDFMYCIIPKSSSLYTLQTKIKKEFLTKFQIKLNQIKKLIRFKIYEQCSIPYI